MAGFRQIHVKMWSSDNWFCALRPEQKLLFIYLFSNEKASVCGLYELPIRVVSFETGLERAQIENALKIFINADKIKYDFENGVIWVKNMLKYQGSSSPKVAARIVADIKQVPNCALKTEVLACLSKSDSGVDSRASDVAPDTSAPDTVSIPYPYGIDTPLSISVSVSNDLKTPPPPVSEKKEISTMLTEGWMATAERIYQGITQQVTLPATDKREMAFQVLWTFFKKSGSENAAITVLKPYFDTWCDKYPGARGNMAWLTEWAVSGQVPKKAPAAPVAKKSFKTNQKTPAPAGMGAGLKPYVPD